VRVALWHICVKSLTSSSLSPPSPTTVSSFACLSPFVLPSLVLAHSQIPKHVTNDDLILKFSREFGPVASVYLMRDRVTQGMNAAYGAGGVGACGLSEGKG